MTKAKTKEIYDKELLIEDLPDFVSFVQHRRNSVLIDDKEICIGIYGHECKIAVKTKWAHFERKLFPLVHAFFFERMMKRV